jgi:hypothetical protein
MSLTKPAMMSSTKNSNNTRTDAVEPGLYKLKQAPRSNSHLLLIVYHHIANLLTILASNLKPNFLLLISQALPALLSNSIKALLSKTTSPQDKPACHYSQNEKKNLTLSRSSGEESRHLLMVTASNAEKITTQVIKDARNG